MPLPTDEATPPVTKMNFDIDRILLPHSLLARYGCASPSLNPGLCHKMPFTRLILIACRRELPLPAALLQDDNLRLLRQAVARDHKLWLRVDGLDAHLPAELVERLKVGARTRSNLGAVMHRDDDARLYLTDHLGGLRRVDCVVGRRWEPAGCPRRQPLPVV